MQSSKKEFRKSKQLPIRENRNVAADLPPAVLDLADLLADIAFRRLRNGTSAPHGQEKHHD